MQSAFSSTVALPVRFVDLPGTPGWRALQLPGYVSIEAGFTSRPDYSTAVVIWYLPKRTSTKEYVSHHSSRLLPAVQKIPWRLIRLAMGEKASVRKATPHIQSFSPGPGTDRCRGRDTPITLTTWASIVKGRAPTIPMRRAALVISPLKSHSPTTISTFGNWARNFA